MNEDQRKELIKSFKEHRYERSRHLIDFHVAGFAYYDGLDVIEELTLGKIDSEIEVYLTRGCDSYISLESKLRSTYANELDEDLFISIHANAFPENHASGTETYYYRWRSRELAQVLHEHVVGATEFNDREIKRKHLSVIKDTNMPAVLLEIGFLTNPDEEQVMLTDEFQA